VPVATKVFVRPIGVEAVAGVTAIELNVAAVTVKVAEPDLPPDVAVIVATPTDTPVAMPGDTTVATGRLLEVHAAILLRSTVVPSVNVPVATNRCVRPIGIEAVNGVTVIELNVAFVTVKVPESDFPPKLAVMTDAPAATAVERPDALLTVATLVVPDVQMEDAVTSRDVPSLYVAIAIYCWGAPVGIAIVAVAGVTAIDTN
jgi:hypothetical protein